MKGIKFIMDLIDVYLHQYWINTKSYLGLF